MKDVRKRKVILFVVMVTLISMLLIACKGSNSSPDVSTSKVEKSTETIQEQTTEPEKISEPEVKEEVKEEAIVQEKVEEELTEEDPYAGIDMESTLPGIEWIATFDGIIKEPTAVIYNDETNKKIIVKEGDELEFSKTKDVLALYTPDVNTMAITGITNEFKDFWIGSSELPDVATSTREIVCQQTINANLNTLDYTFKSLYKGKEKEYKFVLNFVE